ncbi:UDP-N-acetylglucosamine 2-epimerase [Paraglaciecola aquimarina]|uniref:UDP-N-acetylglucosamine 2-epimerase n=1 Tax=Paraglaciecola aquimarina TaxID=1235557 RepID=A0ABU3T1L1_9ALTE|nr:UDP-N-acetylglucosamine 2-epimerase [Paraglaciecola aquimarina]MDU0356120.1 UDP-N-acetylglucosamine 2-epimerase [Paraglaciecola aquimarina]
MRQRGRLAAKSVIHCSANRNDIVAAIQDGISQAYKTNNEAIVNPYGSGDASGQIIKMLKEYKGNIFKSFYDLEIKGDK